MSLYMRVILIVFVLLLLTTGALTAALITSARDDMIKTSLRDLEATTTLLANANAYLLGPASEAGRNAAIQNLVDKLTGKGDIAFIRVVNEKNATLAVSSHPLPGYDQVPSDADWHLIGRARQEGRSQSELSEGVLRAAAPLVDATGKDRGTVFVYAAPDRIWAAVLAAALRGIALALVALVASVLASMALVRSITRPVQQLGQAAQALARGEWRHQIPRSSVREVNALGQAFVSMGAELEEIYSGLERRVAERTRELERRATQIATGAEISYAASQMFNPDEMLSRVAGLIRERFGLYYVGVFLVDENGRNAVLRAGTGEAGRIMVEGGHKLAVGGASMVGWVCANERARIALDVGQEAVRFANPLLPETRSEMALPLRAREHVLGVLDIQSTLAQAFDEKDITALQGMADQIAVALENARLYQQTQSSLKEVERVNRLLTGGRWETFLRAQPNNFAEFHQAEHAPFTPEETQRLAQSPHHAIQPGAIRVPLEVRGQVIGALIVEQPAEGSQAADPSALDSRLLEAVATQAAQVMESARLFEESQRLAAREQVMSTATARMRESLDVETVLKTAVQEVRQAMGLPEVIIRLVPPAPESGDGHPQGEEALA